MSRILDAARRKRRVGMVALLVFVVVGAVWGSNASSARLHSAKATDPGVAKAEQKLRVLLKPPTSIGVTTPLSKRPPTGKTIVFMRNVIPESGAWLPGMKAAAKLLGWKVVSAPTFQQTPEGVQSALQAVIDSKPKPDGIFYSGQDDTVLKAQLAAAKKAGIVVVPGAQPDTPKPPVIGMLLDSKQINELSRGPADWVIADSKGTADILVVSLTAVPILNTEVSAFTSEIKSLCSGCKTTVEYRPPTDIGTNLPGAVVSALTRDPGIKYVAFAVGSMDLGVRAALKSAGLNAKFVVFGSGTPSNLHDIITGQLSAVADFSIPFEGWLAMDTFARYFVGDNTLAATNAPLAQMVITKANVKSQYGGPTDYDFAAPPNYAAAFKKLWHVP